MTDAIALFLKYIENYTELIAEDRIKDLFEKLLQYYPINSSPRAINRFSALINCNINDEKHYILIEKMISKHLIDKYKVGKYWLRDVLVYLHGHSKENYLKVIKILRRRLNKIDGAIKSLEEFGYLS